MNGPLPEDYPKGPGGSPRVMSQVDPDARIERWVRTTCGLCSIGCGLEAGVADGRIAGVRGCIDDVVAGGRLGPKGLSQWHANAHPARVTRPLVRDAAGRLVVASWDVAMERATKVFGGLLAEEGPDAIGFHASGQLLLEEYYALAKIVRGGLGVANLDANTRLCTATTGECLMESFGADGPPGAYADLEQAECIVLIGHNAAEQSTVFWMRVLAAKDGPRRPRVIVIDPRRTLTVTSGADLHLAPRPGTNVALLDGLCRLLIENGTIDRAFLAAHTTGFERFQETVAPYTPEVVEEICGVPGADLRRAAEWIGRSATTVTTCLQGVYQSNQATAAACLVNSMHLLMGKIGKPGSSPLQFAGQPSSMNTRETGVGGTYPAYRNWEDPAHMKALARLWNIAPELLGKKPVTAPDIFEMAAQGQLRALWVVGTNPAVSLPARERQLEALRHTFLVVQEPFLDSEVVAFADVVLPAAMWGEKTGCMTNAERRCHLLEKVVEPPGEARSDLDIFLDLARRLDLRDRDGAPLLAFRDAAGAFDEWREVSRGTIPDYSGMTYEKLRLRGGIQWPCNDRYPEGAERLYEDARFPTGVDEAESYEKDLETGHEHTMREYRAKATPGKARLVAAPYRPPLEAPDAEFPLWYVSGRIAYHWHTRTKTRRAPELEAAAPAAFVVVSPTDAGRLGIEDGDRVRVVSRRGRLLVPARVADTAPPGTVFMPFHYGALDAAEAANVLTLWAWDPASKQPLHKVAAVRLEVVQGEERGR